MVVVFVPGTTGETRMPIYKVYGKRGTERRSRRIQKRMRWTAVALSAVLLGLAVVMMLHMQ